MIDTIFSVSSVLTPFALGAAIGAIATGRVTVGNAGAHLFSSWLNPTSIFIGMVAVANCAYLAAWRPTPRGLAIVSLSERFGGERCAPGWWPALLRSAALSSSTTNITGSFTRC